MKVVSDPKMVDEVLARGTADLIIKENLRNEMLSGRQLKIYLGTDPTGSELHLGHAVIHKKLRDFQELGHKVTLVVGDFTVLVGDHSDRTDERKEINRKLIEENMKSYKDQFAKTVDISQVELAHNSTWLAKLDFNDVIELAKIFTVGQMTERDAFQKRRSEGKPVGFDELLYPLMQGYDAYALRTDIQIGGTDQLFNMQAGRKIMEHFRTKPQNIITTPLLVGNDGRKMGKSLNNYISIYSSAFDKYAGIMSIVDEIIPEYFVLLTRVPMAEISQMEKALKEGSVNPRDIKMKLALEITKSFHTGKEALEAERKFKKVVSERGVPDDIREAKIRGSKNIIDALVELNLTKSKTQARRLIMQGGVEVSGKKILSVNEIINLEPETIIRVGKRDFVKIV